MVPMARWGCRCQSSSATLLATARTFLGACAHVATCAHNTKRAHRRAPLANLPCVHRCLRVPPLRRWLRRGPGGVAGSALGGSAAMGPRPLVPPAVHRLGSALRPLGTPDP